MTTETKSPHPPLEYTFAAFLVDDHYQERPLAYSITFGRCEESAGHEAEKRFVQELGEEGWYMMPVSVTSPCRPVRRPVGWGRRSAEAVTP